MNKYTAHRMGLVTDEKPAKQSRILELEKNKPFYKSMTITSWITLGVIVATGIFYLFTHHKSHVIDALPYTLFLVIILMHVFMHGGHSHGGKDTHGLH